MPFAPPWISVNNEETEEWEMNTANQRGLSCRDSFKERTRGKSSETLISLPETCTGF
jgi:hypothetical protein